MKKPKQIKVFGSHPSPSKSKADELLEAAWGIIANAGGWDWKTQSKEWQIAAAGWRDQYHKGLPKIMHPVAQRI